MAGWPHRRHSVWRQTTRWKRTSDSSEMPPYPPFRPLHPPHPSFLPTRLQWYKFASNPLTSDAFESVTVQQLLDIHVTAASANRVEMSFTQIPFAEGRWVEIIILKNNKTNQNLVFVLFWWLSKSWSPRKRYISRTRWFIFLDFVHPNPVSVNGVKKFNSCIVGSLYPRSHNYQSMKFMWLTYEKVFEILYELQMLMLSKWELSPT